MHAAQRVFGFGCALFIVLAGSVPAPAESWRVQVRGDGTDLGETPVVVALEKPCPAGFVLDLSALEPRRPGLRRRGQVLSSGDLRPRLARRVATYTLSPVIRRFPRLPVSRSSATTITSRSSSTASSSPNI